MYTFELYLHGVNHIRNLPDPIKANMLKALHEGMLIAKNKAQKSFMTGPRPERLGVVTGRLRSSLYFGARLSRGTESFMEGYLGSQRVVYAAIHELGGKTSPHEIRAKNVPYLIFFWEKIGRWMRIKKVKHPGSRIPARPYLDYGLRSSLPKIFVLIQAAIEEAYVKS